MKKDKEKPPLDVLWEFRASFDYALLINFSGYLRRR